MSRRPLILASSSPARLRLLRDAGFDPEVVVSGIEPGTGRSRVVEADAFEARAFQNEIDHVDGLLFVDRVRAPHGLHRRKTYG